MLADVYCERDRKTVSQRIIIKENTLSERTKNYIAEKLKLNYETL
jgi:hypothetical protein